MSNAQNAQIMGQVMSVVDRLAGNPNSKLDATNVIDLINKLTETVSAGYQRVADLETSTSLTAAVTPARTAAEVTTAPETSAAVEAPAVAEAAPAETPVAVVTATPKATATAQPVKAAAKRTATAAVKSAPASKAPAAKTVAKAPAPAPVAEAPAAKTETVSKAAPSKATAKASKKTKEAPAPVTNEDKDVATAESMIQEHGSARAAAAYVEKNRTRGRKTAWQKIIEERADQELRASAKNHKKVNAEGLAAAIASAQQDRKDKKSEKTDAQAAREYSLKTTGYPFSHIERKPFMDPEKALGAEITCLIDGSKRTMMSRYIDAKYAMTPEEYIAHFDLRPDYPMTADLYKKEKRRLAGEQGLGQRKADEEAAAPVEQATPATTKRRSRQRAAA
ncbi:MucR family transcriptional regulator [Pararhizobium sp. BT-229]|uniref:MucR family transcriptional regulator n=1 Tax=Pararhizobium sp. BT-229 TaxID=2986923 RepID=UPI0021F7EC8F|nr:MucR family transcriptional regulator [Pararhizobium sp. BT-229]MCV9963786.1 MucR family transcriptional regulator [Pararhizobium sp. BT-229]